MKIFAWIIAAGMIILPTVTNMIFPFSFWWLPVAAGTILAAVLVITKI